MFPLIENNYDYYYFPQNNIKRSTCPGMNLGKNNYAINVQLKITVLAGSLVIFGRKIGIYEYTCRS